MRVYLLILFPCSKSFSKHWYDRQEAAIAGMYLCCHRLCRCKANRFRAIM